MIDNLSIALSHGLLIWTFWILIRSDHLNNEPPPPLDPESAGFAKQRTNAPRTNDIVKPEGRADA
jgi:hypothetical protein